MWSKLATNNDGANWADPPPPGYKPPVFQRRKSSAQVGLLVITLAFALMIAGSLLAGVCEERGLDGHGRAIKGRVGHHQCLAVFGVGGDGEDLAVLGDALDVGVLGEGVIDEVLADNEAAPWRGAEVVAVGEQVVRFGLQEKFEGVGFFRLAGWQEAEELATAGRAAIGAADENAVRRVVDALAAGESRGPGGVAADAEVIGG